MHHINPDSACLADARDAPTFSRSCRTRTHYEADPGCNGVSGVSRTTLFRWLKQFRRERPDQRARAAPPRPRFRACGRWRQMSSPSSSGISGGFYATRRRPDADALLARGRRRLPARGIAGSVHSSSWPLACSPRSRPNCCDSAKAKGKSDPVFLATPGTLDAAAPLAIVQIDHTKVDVTVVDPDHATSYWPADADAGDRRQHADGDGIPSLAGSAFAGGRGAVSDPCGDGQDDLARGSGDRGRMAGAGDPRRHSCRQRRGIPRAGVRARLRRTSASILSTDRREHRASAAISSG